MFRFIGIVVVLFVIFIGWNQIKDFYEGNISGKEAVTEIREKTAESLRSNSEGNLGAKPAKAPQTAEPAALAEKDPFSMANQLLSK